jgi:exopolysaccharide biosynthesis predicted pyruvyltransferase EpsI
MTINDFFDNYKGEKVFFKPNPGNAGDAMINHAAVQLMRKHEIDFQFVGSDDDLSDKLVFYSGGGNFVSYYSNAANFIGKWHDKARRLVILPSTINSHEDLIAKLGQNVDIMLREKVSFDYVSKMNKNSRKFLMDDLAISLDLKEFWKYLEEPKGNFRSQLNHSLLRFISSRFKLQSKTLNSYRDDMEKPDMILPKDNIDISRLLEVSEQSEASIKELAYYLLFFIKQFDIINTNRLHVCLAGAILGKEVNFYPNSYYKNRAVYEFSMKGKFKKVNWKG